MAEVQMTSFRGSLYDDTVSPDEIYDDTSTSNANNTAAGTDDFYEDVDAKSKNNVFDNPTFTSDDGQVRIPIKSPKKKNVTPSGSVSPLTPPADGTEGALCCPGCAEVQDNVAVWFKENKATLKGLFLGLLVLGYAGYFAYALYYEFGSESSIRLLWVTSTVAVCMAISVIKDWYGEAIYSNVLEPPTKCIQDKWHILRWFFYGAVVIGIVVYLVVDVAIDNPYNIVSISGIVVYILLFYVFSFAPSKVNWQPVGWGLGLQFILAIIILRTSWGFDAFEWLGDRVSEFLAYTDAGSQFVFDEAYEKHFFAFKVMPVVIFFSSVISVLYYLGVMQVVISKIAWVMQRTMGTTAAESVNAAGNIFVGQTEAPLLIRPMIHSMTRSELHAVMTGGFATIAGSVMATYILFGVPANHLISASVMSAPAALAMSKLFYPETQKSTTTTEDVAKMEKSPERNVIEAASNGASAAIHLVANIVANLIAFIALLEFLNSTLIWFGARVGITEPDYPPLTFQFICSYVLWPFAFLMGVEASDCRQVAQLIGVKTFLNEFVAFSDLSVLIENTDTFNAYNGTVEYHNDDIYLKDTDTWLRGGVMEQRSIVISTYALCGFANFSSIGIMLGGLGAMAPERKSEMAPIAIRAMIAGNVACFLTACIAGLLYLN